jgi:hypothetical protein
VQYWRELPATEQSAALASAERILSARPTCAELQPDFPAEEFDRLCRLAQDQLAQKFDLPPQFPPRAREGLLSSLVLAAANEALGDEPYSDPTVAEIHLLLLKPE